MKHAITCNYAVVRFLPYLETGEFANVGIVVFAPETRYFGFKLETVKVSRVTDFFPEMEASFYREALRLFRKQLQTFQDAFGSKNPLQTDWAPDGEQAKNLFRELIRTRESVIRFSEAGTILATDPAKAMDGLFQRYVERQFAQVGEFQEQLMAKALKGLLLKKHVTGYVPVRLGNERFGVKVPFARFAVAVDSSKPERAIRPINLSIADSTKVIEKSIIWNGRLEQLKKDQAMPGAFLLVVKMPKTDGYSLEAADKAVVDFEKRGCRVLMQDAQKDIVEFAKTLH